MVRVLEERQMTPEIKWQYYPRVTAHPAAKAFVESLAKRQKAPKTIDAYARNLEDLLATWPDAPPERVVDADAGDVDTYLERLFARGPVHADRPVVHLTGRGLADATIQQRIVTAGPFFDFCVHRQLRTEARNPVPRGRWRGPRPVRGLVP